MKIKTELLQNMISKAIKGASNNNMIPITSLIGIEVHKDTLILMTTDGSNQLRINAKIDYDTLYGSNNFYTIVNADTFSKLVSKTTKEFIELENKENYLEVIGNGTYKLELAINEDGEMVKFPEIKNLEGNQFTLNLPILQEQIKTAKASVAKTMEVPCLTGYYIGNNTISTDRQMVCFIQNREMEEPLLISSEMAELLLLVDGTDIIEILKKDNQLIFYTDKYTIAGKELEGKEMYPVAAIENLVALNYKNSIKINKQELLNILDRMSLFITDYDKNGVYLSFTADGLVIRSQKSNAEEIIDFEGIIDAENTFNCLVDIEMLKSQIETVSTDIIEIYYGQEKSIKIVDGDCSLVISLLEKSN